MLCLGYGVGIRPLASGDSRGTIGFQFPSTLSTRIPTAQSIRFPLTSIPSRGQANNVSQYISSPQPFHSTASAGLVTAPYTSYPPNDIIRTNQLVPQSIPVSQVNKQQVMPFSMDSVSQFALPRPIISASTVPVNQATNLNKQLLMNQPQSTNQSKQIPMIQTQLPLNHTRPSSQANLNHTTVNQSQSAYQSRLAPVNSTQFSNQSASQSAINQLLHNTNLSTRLADGMGPVHEVDSTLVRRSHSFTTTPTSQQAAYLQGLF